ncbi:MAG: metal ABC transporter ATP-binding protein [Myxococcota bacterium]
MNITATVQYALETRGLSVRYENVRALEDVSVEFVERSLTGIVGPNGAGKSTLLKATLGLVASSGTVRFFGAPYRRGDERVVYVPQRRSIDWDFPVTVRDVVRQGRFHRVGLLRRFSSEDQDAVEQALAKTRIADFADRQIGELSGGQQQRVFLARALAQGGQLMLLDEPFAGIDAATEAELLNLLRDLRDNGKTIVVVHHDLGTVRRSFDRLVLLNQRLVAAGPTEAIFTRENLQAAYGDRLTVVDGAAMIDG